MAAHQSKTVGIWTSGSSSKSDGWARTAAGAQVVEQLGFDELWISGGFESGLPVMFDDAIAATVSIPIASGIITVYHTDPTEIGARVAALQAASPGRFILGLGASHGTMVERLGQSYAKPYSQMVQYLDALDALETPVPPSARMLAALGPRMLTLSAERSLGAHPYFVPVEHTAYARQIMGEGPRLAPEQAVVLESDPTRAREIARGHMRGYLTLPNYTGNLRRLGWGDEDLNDGGSDKLVDAIVAWGSVDAIADRVRSHHDAGADTVLLQVIVGGPDETQENAYRELAAALL
jgi:probable F420-dependent oxidoreductase